MSAASGDGEPASRASTSSLGPRPTALGRYELITQIGQGGMAEVQLALQRGPAGFEKLVVVKLIHENLATQKDFVDMLLDEARVAALVKHPNVVDIYDLGEAAGRYFIAMEYLEGEPLLAVLRAGREGKRLDVLSTARLISDTAEGLDAAHELRNIAGEAMELVHHDVSLGNIVVLYNGQVKLVDFGVAKATQTTAARTRVQGKFSYMAPEKLRGGAGDRRSDIWSLGCVMWESLTLKRLFKGGNDSDTMRQVLESQIPKPSAINGDVPAFFDDIVMTALDRDPATRFPTAKAMSAAIEEVLRLQAYGGKNEIIARYMQATFDDHIVARKKLLQEVASKGRASLEVLEAAFDEGPIASGTPMSSGEFSVKFRRSNTESSVAEEPSFSRGKAPSSSPLAPIARRSGPIEAVTAAASGGAWVPEVAPAATGTSTVVSRRQRGGLIALVILLVAVIAGAAYVVLGRGEAERADEVAPPPAPVAKPAAAVVVAPDAAVAVDAAVVVVVDAAEVVPVDAAEVGPVDAAEDVVPDAAEAASAPAVRRLNAEALYKQGLQTFVRGDAKAALMLFKRAQAVNPAYAPTWRGLGLAHEKLGELGAARSAFQRYLVLAPTAADAEQIRARMGAL